MTHALALPPIIQGGMGVGVSNWRLARAVALCGQLGVVSGTALDSVLVRRLQDGDLGGHIRRAMERFPLRQAAEDALKRYFRPEGRAADEPYAALPMYRQGASAERERLTMLASFVEVFLAKEGHDRPVGINLLTKIQLPTLASLYGAMLAGVDVVLMGAGIPKEVPAALDALALHQPAAMRLEVEGLSPETPERMRLTPADHFPVTPAPLTRPVFLPIIASNSLATMLSRKASGRVDGFIIEGPTAGGHNAPPRGEPTFNERGEPVYGPRDEVDLAKIAELGLPFWVAGGMGSAEHLRMVQAQGAAGIQVGTLFAFCEDSGLNPELRASVLRRAAKAEVDVLTSAQASPTGYPFKVVRWDDDPALHHDRGRICDLGYLRSAYREPDGGIGYRCASEPEDQYMKKGGTMEETVGRQCLCNGLMANIGMGQVRDGGLEPPLLTSGDDLKVIAKFLKGRNSYSAADVLEALLAPA